MGKPKSIPKGAIARSTELLKMAAKVGKEELKHRFTHANENTGAALAKQVEQLRALVDSLGRLKGAAMKVGQLLSMDFADFFPPEARAILEQLQNKSAHCLPFDEVIAILRHELAENFDKLTEVSAAPIAAASIGQVHTARYGDQKIALKIQYPGIPNCIDSDLKILQGVIQSLVSLSRRKMDLSCLFDELKAVFRGETNYLDEAAHLKQYREIFRDHPGYKVPVPVDELCTRRVLAMNFEEGITLRDWIASNFDLDRREAMGKKILDLYMIEYFEHAFVQSDPNPSNFLVNSDQQLVLLDLGAVKTFKPDFVRNYVALMECVHRRDKDAALAQAESMGFIDPREMREAKDAFFDMLRSSICAFDDDRQPFDFNDKSYFKECQNISSAFTCQSEYSPPPFELLFLHRKLVGIFGILKDLKLALDLTSYWNRVILSQQ